MTLPGTYAGRPALTWGKPALLPVPLFQGGKPSLYICGGEFLLFPLKMGPGSYKKTVTFNLTDISSSVSRGELVEVIKAKFSPAIVLSIRFVPVKRVQVTFEDSKMKDHVEKFETIDFNGVKCPIVSGGPSAQNILIYHFPYEEDDSRLKTFLSPFGKILNIRYQHFPGMPEVSTGTRIVRMVRDKAIPRNLNIGNIRVKCWYVGQPIECDICRGAHVAKDCPIRGKCRNCRQEIGRAHV